MPRKFSYVYPEKDQDEDDKPGKKMSEPNDYAEDEAEMESPKVLKPGYSKELKG